MSKFTVEERDGCVIVTGEVSIIAMPHLMRIAPPDSQVPELQSRLPEMAKVSPEWAGLVRDWNKISTSMHLECNDIENPKPGSQATDTYNLIKISIGQRT